MEKFLQLFKQLERRPTMYIGEPNIFCLKAYLDGWLLASAVNSETMDFFVAFQEFIAKKYKVTATQSWAHILAFFSPNQSAALDLALRELQEFLKQAALIYPSKHIESELMRLGQLALEVECDCEGLREFVSVYAGSRTRLMNAEQRFYYYRKSPCLFRVVRFRVDKELLSADKNVGPDDLFDLQEIYLPDIESVEYVLRLWNVDIRNLAPPAECDIPV